MGITEVVLDWIMLYMSDRKIKVRVGDALSDPWNLPCGVPQGSKLGPVLFLVYISSLFEQLDNHPVEKLSYADDTQLYCHFKATNIADVKLAVERCVTHARTWIMTHEFKIRKLNFCSWAPDSKHL